MKNNELAFEGKIWDIGTLHVFKEKSQQSAYGIYNSEWDLIEKYFVEYKEDALGLEWQLDNAEMFPDTVEDIHEIFCWDPPTVPIIFLKREKDYWHNKVYYFVNISSRNLDTGKDTLVSSQKYAGTDRNIAIKDFKAYVKNHPGIIYETNVKIAGL